MAMSLEELLAKEGFKERKPKISSKSSFPSHTVNLPLYPYREQRKSKTPPTIKRTERAKSDLLQRGRTNYEYPKANNRMNMRGSRSNNSLMNEKIDEKSERVANYIREAQKFSAEPPEEDFLEDEKADSRFDSGEMYKDIYSNEIYSPQKGIKFDDRKTMKQYKENKISPNSSEPAIDEAAIRAVISILSGHIKRFLRDGDFRTSLHHDCFSSLNFSELEEDLITENKVLANLEQAIEVVERAAESRASSIELKKASLQLSVITGLNSNELKYGFTSGIPNSKLSACAHLYLSVVYKLQKKDRISAKHLLQVFCDSPFQARTILLPELWENMFLPHLAHLKEWYDRELDLLIDTPSKDRKLKLLEKVYNEIIDSGTNQFAIYYKDWLANGVESPSIPFIKVPSIPIQATKQVSTSLSSKEIYDKGASIDFPHQAMVSRRLYDAVFGRSLKPGVDEVEDYKESEIFPNSLISSGSSSIQEKQELPCCSSTKGEVVAKEACELHQASPTNQEFISDKLGKSPQFMVNNPEANELTRKQLAQSAFAEAIIIKSNCKESNVIYDDFDDELSSSSIPQDFLCPLTGLVFEEPVTLETGHTFERVSITQWLSEGHRTCPVSGKTLECQSVPLTNFVLKRVITSWKSSFSSKIKDEAALFIIHQIVTASSEEERLTNARHLISLGGLRFLIEKFKNGNLEEKSRLAAVFLYCIRADNSCRNYIAKNIEKSCLVELIRSEKIKSKANVVLLLLEFICLNRRRDIESFVNGLKDERLSDTMNAISISLQNSPPEQRPLVATLLLHLDLLIDPQEYSIYREEAVDAITLALDDSLSNEKIQENCCRALLILGGRFSSSGKIMTEDWILKQSGFLNGPGRTSFDHDEADLLAEDIFSLDSDEEMEKEEWLRRLSVALICDGKRSFLESISKCLGCTTSLDSVRVCLTTVAWLTSALALFSDNEFPLSVFSSLISRLKRILESCDLVEHKVLACMSMFNFSKIPECRIMLKTLGKEIAVPLRDLAEVTWTAKKLYKIIS